MSSSSPPVCGGLPGIGAFPRLMKEQLSFFTNARERYGDIYTLDLGVMKLLVLNHPDHAQYILRDQAHRYRKTGAVWESVRALVGYGLPANDGDLWKRQRRMMQPFFHKEKLGMLTSYMVDAIEAGLDHWERVAPPGEPFNVGHALNHLTMDVVVKALLGGDISEAEMETVSHAMRYAPKYLISDLISRSVPSWMPVPGVQRFRESVKSIDDVVFQLIERRRGQKYEGGDLLGMLMNLVDAETGEQMTDRQLRDEATALFLAGHETMAMTLSFALGMLMDRPDVLGPLKEEVDSVLGGARPTFAHLSRLPLTAMVFNEAMRLYPTSFWFPRTAMEDDELDGFHVPAKTSLALMSYVIQRHPDFWEEPERFDPWRFSPERSAGRHPMAWIPFGTGQRLCIGKEFALMEGVFVLASLLSRFEIAPVAGKPLQVQMGITLQTRDGLMLRLHRRDRRPSSSARVV